LQCVAVCCSVLQCVAVCCSVLQCVAVYCRNHITHTYVSQNMNTSSCDTHTYTSHVTHMHMSNIICMVSRTHYFAETFCWHGFCWYGVATITRLLKIVVLFCRESSLLHGFFAKETYDFKDPTNRSHPICVWERVSGIWICKVNRDNMSYYDTLQHTAHIDMCVRTCEFCMNMYDEVKFIGKICHTATHCGTLQHTATHCNTLQHTATLCSALQRNATHCNTLQHTAIHCNTLQLITSHYNASWICHEELQHTATHCNTLQHITSHYM